MKFESFKYETDIFLYMASVILKIHVFLIFVINSISANLFHKKIKENTIKINQTVFRDAIKEYVKRKTSRKSVAKLYRTKICY